MSIKKGDQIFLRPEWQDEGDEQYDWFAMEDEIPGHSLKVQAIHRDPEHISHGFRFAPIHTVQLDMLEV